MSDDTAQSHMVAARGLFDAGNFESAERTLKQALAADPELAGAHSLLSLAQYRRGKGREALLTAREAIALAPNATAFRAQCLALTQLGRKAEAVAAGEAAVAADPVDELAQLVLGVALEEAKRLGEAEAAFRAAVRLAPGNSAIRADFGRFLLRQKRLAEAEVEAGGIDSASDRPTVLLLRGEVALRRGRTADARDYALWILSGDATNAGALRLLTQVKASKSPLLGLWWRYALFMALKPAWVRFLVIVPALGLLAVTLSPVFLVFILYLRISGAVFAHMVRQELKAVTLKNRF